MISKDLETLIEEAIVDGIIDNKAKVLLQKRAQAEGWDIEEFDLILNNRLSKKSRQREIERRNSLANNLIRNIEEIKTRYSRIISDIQGEQMPEIHKLKSKHISDFASLHADFEENREKRLYDAESEKKYQIRQLFRHLIIPDIQYDVEELLVCLKPFISEYKEAEEKYNQCYQLAKDKYSYSAVIKKLFEEEEEKKRIEEEKKEKERKNRELWDAFNRTLTISEDEGQTLKRLEYEVDKIKKEKYTSSHGKSKAVAAVIESFILPKEKEDILPLLKKLKSYYNKKIWENRDKDYRIEAEAYRNKYIELGYLAQSLFPNDSEIQSLIIIDDTEEEEEGFWKRLLKNIFN